jgi:NAD-dependent deacetylase
LPSRWARSSADDPVKAAARLLRERRHAVALTGAGISVESGIPAFRGSQGLWGKYDPAEYATIGAFLRDPGKVWRMLSEMAALCGEASPNPAHAGLAELEGMGIVRSVITQNVDGLHQAAGSRQVIEYHGNMESLVCISCWKQYPTRERWAGQDAPACECGQILKPNVVLFGEPIPWLAQERAEEEARTCGVLLVAGTSAQVSPACDIPRIAKRAGASVVEINPEETALTASVTDIHIPGSASSILRSILEDLKGLHSPSSDTPSRH